MVQSYPPKLAQQRQIQKAKHKPDPNAVAPELGPPWCSGKGGVKGLGGLTLLHHTILYHTILHHFTLYHAMLYHAILYCAMLYYAQRIFASACVVLGSSGGVRRCARLGSPWPGQPGLGFVDSLDVWGWLCGKEM